MSQLLKTILESDATLYTLQTGDKVACFAIYDGKIELISLQVANALEFELTKDQTFFTVEGYGFSKQDHVAELLASHYNLAKLKLRKL